MKTYLINEIFHTIQGEGHWTGRAAVFVRFSRCNLWNGREDGRSTAICQFCDTDFNAATRMTQQQIAEEVWRAWPVSALKPMVVFTGGEPLLQLDEALIWALKYLGFYAALETNGTFPIPDGIDWICVSPKAGTVMRALWAHELKLVYPQPKLKPEAFIGYPADIKWLSPMDGPHKDENTAAAIEYVKSDPTWRLNVQTHKMIGVR